MLVLSRKLDEQIVIRMDGQDVWVRVVSIERDRVRLGFVAPRDVAVLREEIVARMEKDECELAAV